MREQVADAVGLRSGMNVDVEAVLRHTGDVCASNELAHSLCSDGGENHGESAPMAVRWPIHFLLTSSVHGAEWYSDNRLLRGTALVLAKGETRQHL